MPEGFRLRIKYVKHGRLAYLSHLETVRSIERIIRRARLPYAITEGFNPHMKIAFGPALAVGIASDGEYVDLRMVDYVSAKEALRRLQDAAPFALMPYACRYIDMHDDAITVAYPLSDWRAEFSCGDFNGLSNAFNELIAQGHIVVRRKKKKDRQIDFEGRLVCPVSFALEDGHATCSFTTRDVGRGAIRPDKFIEAAMALIQTPPQLLSLTRTALRAEEKSE